MSPLALSDTQMREVRRAALSIPYDLGPVFVHKIAYQVARAVTWDAGRTATG